MKRTSAKERWGFALFLAGQGIMNAFVTTFMQSRFTDIGIAAAAVGAILFVGRIWDAFNDPMFGAVIDRVKLKGGKFLPWLKLSGILLPIATVLMFAVPGSLPAGVVFVLALVAYLVYDASYTMADVPYYSMTSAATDQVQERVSIMSWSVVFNSVATIIISALIPLVYKAYGGLVAAAGVAVFCGVMMHFMPGWSKERYINKDPEPLSLKGTLAYLKENKYLRISFIAGTLLNITNMSSAVMVFFAVNCLNDMSAVTALTVFSALPALLMGALIPSIVKKIDKFILFCVSSAGFVAMSVICFIAGYQNYALFAVLMVIRGFFYGTQLILQMMFTGDIVEYGEYVTGKRLQGTAYSVQTFGFKLMSSIPASLAMVLLGAVGFASGEGAIQPPAAISAIWAMFIISPLAGAVFAVPFLLRYKLRDKLVQTMAAANSGEMPREEAEQLLVGKI
ncbi:MAG: MFS transporter [Clostridiales bacterium]|jgi:Na+/melibiose symporter-like transporter|nr:MFS transporter [Clostridiales bacterium]